MDELQDDRAFQKKYMTPVEVALSRKKTILVDEDEGVRPCTAEGLAKQTFLPGVHPESNFEHPQVSSSETRNFLQVQGNRDVGRRRTIVRRTTNTAN